MTDRPDFTDEELALLREVINPFQNVNFSAQTDSDGTSVEDQLKALLSQEVDPAELKAVMRVATVVATTTWAVIFSIGLFIGYRLGRKA